MTKRGLFVSLLVLGEIYTVQAECTLPGGQRGSAQDYRIAAEQAEKARDGTRTIECYLASIASYPKNLQPKQKQEVAALHSRVARVLSSANEMQMAMDHYKIAAEVNSDVEDLLQLAMLSFQLGHTSQTIAAYSALLKTHGHIPEIHHNLAAAFVEQGRIAEAVPYFRKAIELKKDFDKSYQALASAHARNGEVREAFSVLASGVQAMPTDEGKSETMLSAGHLYRDMSAAQNVVYKDDTGPRAAPDAERAFKAAIRLNPKGEMPLYNYGTVLLDLERYEESSRMFERSVRIKPTVLALDGIGTVAQRRGQREKSHKYYEMALKVNPRFAATYFNLGCLYLEAKDWKKAVDIFVMTTQLDPTNFGAYFNGGLAMKMLGRFQDSIQSYIQAAKLKPQDGNVWNNLAGAYTAANLVDESIGAFEKALAVGLPDTMKAATILNLMFTRASICDWSHYEEETRVLEEVMRERKGLERIQPFHILSLSDSQDVLQQMDLITQVWNQDAKRQVTFFGNKIFQHPAPDFIPMIGRAPIRVGIYTADTFQYHPTAQVMDPMFYLHDPSRVQIVHIFLRDGQQQEFQKRGGDPSSFIDCTFMSTPDAAAAVNRLQLQVLVDVNGHTQYARHEVLAFQPSPIQIHHLDFHTTMGGLDQYFTVDPVAAPPDFAPHYQDKFMYMWNGYHTGGYAARGLIPTAPQPGSPEQGSARAAEGLPSDPNVFVFCSFNKLAKLDPHTFAVWMRIMKRVPNSVLWMFGQPSQAEQHLRKEMRNALGDDTRMFIAPRKELKEHLARMVLADLFLDNPKYSGGVTACDSATAGLPMLSIPRLTPTSRTAAGVQLSANVGRYMLVRNYADYEEVAVTMAQKRHNTLRVRSMLERGRNTDRLHDDKRWVYAFESGLRLMWDTHANAGRPHHVLVNG